MTVSTLIQSNSKTIHTGVRPVDPTFDAPAIVSLIEIGFGEELDPQGRKMLQQMRRAVRCSQWAPWLFGPALDSAGFVYVWKGEVVGNLSLRYALPYSSQGRLVGNVVVRPDCRGRGFGRALVEAAMEMAKAQSARWIGLEVRADNAVACHLYEQLGFAPVGQIQHLVRPEGLVWPNYALPRYPWRSCRPSDSALWCMLAEQVYPARQRAALEIRPGLYKFRGWEQSLEAWFSGQRERAWVYAPTKARLALHVKTESWHRYHVWDMLAHPESTDSDVQEVVAQGLQAMRRFPPWPVVALLSGQSPVIPALCAIGFARHRTLVQMIADL